MSRRSAIANVCGVIFALCAMLCSARADDYPSRPIHLIITTPAGSLVDVLGRLYAEAMSARLGQPMVVDNRSGGMTMLGTDVLTHADPDGYTLLIATSSLAINPSLYPDAGYDPKKDFAAVGLIASSPNLVLVNPSLPVKTIPELIAYAKANPGALNFASSGVGSTLHVAGELFKMMTGVNIVHVPYRGGAPAMLDLIAGRAQIMFDNVPTSLPYIRDGKIRPLAVTSAARVDVLPDLPLVADNVPGYEASAWYGIVGPKGMPAEVVDKLGQYAEAGASRAYLQVLDLQDLDHLELIAAEVMPQVR